MAIDEGQLRASRRAELLGNLAQDVRHALRRLVKSPAFTIVTVLTLAVGIGPNIAIFSIINSVLLAPLPYAAPEQLMFVQETFPLSGGRNGNGSVSWENFVDWRTRNRSFSEMALSSWTSSANLGGTDRPERLSIARITHGTWPMLEAQPILGRNFTEEETTPGGGDVVMISETLWRSKYGADPAILGERIVLDGVARQVVGVMPERIVFPNVSSVIHAWLPMQFQPPPGGSRGSHGFRVVGRLRPGITPEAATSDMKAIAAQLELDYPQDQEGRSVAVTPLVEYSIGWVKPQLGILFGAAGLVLLIACANAASMLLARAAGRAREVAVLAALGASRLRLAQQFLSEGVLLSAAGAAIGFLLGLAAVKGIIVSAGPQLPRSREIHYDMTVVAFIAGTIVLTTLLFGLVPALRATRTNLQSGLREAARGASGGPGAGVIRSSLVVAQCALSLVLLAGAGLLLRTFAALVGTDTGMPTDRMLTMRIPVPVGSTRYPTGAAANARFHTPLMQQISAIPGVEGVGLISQLPLQEFGSNGNFQIVGKTYQSMAERPFAEMRVITPGYFKALGIAILGGREFSVSDDSAAQPVVIVNDVVGKRYFDNKNPVGEMVQFGAAGPNNPPSAIVGVVRAVRQARLDREPIPELYFPTNQAFWAMRELSLVVRASDPARLVGPVQDAIRRVDPEQPVYLVKTMSQVVSDSIADRRLYLRLLGAFSAIALLLAIAGIYGVISYSVTQRTREFGIRLALGSETRRLTRLVVWSGARLAAMGIVIGVPVALAATRLLRGVVYGVSPVDPATFAVVAAILGLVALLASYVPAKRAARVDPIIAMRAE